MGCRISPHRRRSDKGPKKRSKASFFDGPISAAGCRRPPGRILSSDLHVETPAKLIPFKFVINTGAPSLVVFASAPAKVVDALCANRGKVLSGKAGGDRLFESSGG